MYGRPRVIGDVAQDELNGLLDGHDSAINNQREIEAQSPPDMLEREFYCGCLHDGCLSRLSAIVLTTIQPLSNI